MRAGRDSVAGVVAIAGIGFSIEDISHMKKTALTILLAGALLCAGCSDSTETTAVVTATPAPEATISAAEKAELNEKLAINNLPPVDATATPTPSATP